MIGNIYNGKKTAPYDDDDDDGGDKNNGDNDNDTK